MSKLTDLSQAFDNAVINEQQAQKAYDSAKSAFDAASANLNSAAANVRDANNAIQAELSKTVNNLPGAVQVATTV